MDISERKIDFNDSGRKILINEQLIYMWVHGNLDNPPVRLASEYIHTHLRYEVHVPGEKGLRVQIEGETVAISPNELLIVAPNIYHFFLPESNGRRCFSYYCPKSTKEMHIPLKFKASYICCTATKEINLFLQIVEEERCSTKELHEEMETQLFSCLILSLLRCIEKKPSLIAHTVNEYNQCTIDIIDQYFHIKQNSTPRKKELADLLNVSERQLERIVNSVFGMSFRQKIQKVRFDTARFLLDNLNYSKEQVAEIIGYSSGQAFYNAYRVYLEKQKTK